MIKGKNIYFASDFHLGVPNEKESLEREKKIVRWLDYIKNDAAEIYLMGDLFDFWFEYKTAVPKGFIRILGKIAELTDAGIPVYLFTGNHDMWMFDYLPKEIGVEIIRKPIVKTFFGKKYYLAHGDGLGPGDYGYKTIKKIFANKICQWLFARIHPNLGISVAKFWSGKSRIANKQIDETFLGEENEWLVVYSRQVLKNEHYDYFLFGHRHLPLSIKLEENSQYFNLGEWIKHFTYVKTDEKETRLLIFE